MPKSKFTIQEIEASRRQIIRERNRMIGRYTPPSDEDDLADQIEYLTEHQED